MRSQVFKGYEIMATKLAWIPLTTKNVQEAINIGIRIFGEADAPGINFAFKASVGILPDADILAADPYVESLKYFIVTKDGKPAGITGYYTIKDHAEDKWLGWMAYCLNSGVKAYQPRWLAAALKSMAKQLLSIEYGLPMNQIMMPQEFFTAKWALLKKATDLKLLTPLAW